MKHPATLTYAAFRNDGSTRRFLFCKTEEKPHFGDPTFDFLAYFGFGSGELGSRLPHDYVDLRVKEFQLGREEALVEIYKLFTKPTDAFSGFFTADGDLFTILVEHPEGKLLFELPELNWHYYTQIGGDRHTAKAHIGALSRRHILFERAETQQRLLNEYKELTTLF